MMKNKILISVIVPVYQVEAYLEQCLNSILPQLKDNMELILVDDGSKDNSGEICDSYSKRDDKIIVIHKDNGGLMSAWLAGVNVARGEYTVFVDSDDWISPNMIEDFLTVYSKFNPDIICCNFLKEYADHSVKDVHPIECGYYSKDKIVQEIFPKLINDGEYLSRGIRICRWAKMIKTRIIIDCVKYCNLDITIGEDLNIMFPVIVNAQSIYIMRDSFNYHYRSNSESIMGTCSPVMWKQIIKLYTTLKVINEDYRKEFDFTYQIDRNLSDLILFVAYKELSSENDKLENIKGILATDEYKIVRPYLSMREYGFTRNGVLAVCLRIHRMPLFRIYRRLLIHGRRGAR